MNLKPTLIFEKKLFFESELSGVILEMAAYFDKTSVLLLSGDLGAGKTTSVRYLCEFYGTQSAQSPTYAIHQRYSGKNKIIDHFDLYRLQTDEDLVSTGFWDLLQEQNSLVLVEWFERIPDPSWLEFEAQKRKIFGLKIKIENSTRLFQFFQLK